MMPYRRYPLTLLGLAACIACSAPDHTGDLLAPAVVADGAQEHAEGHLDLRAVRAELLAADRAYSAASASTSFTDGLANTLTADARYLPAGGPIVGGRETVRGLLASNPASALSTYTWAPIRVDVSDDGTTGYTYGYYELRIPAVGEVPARTSFGKYIAFWRNVGGTWQVAALVRNPRAPGAVSDTPPAGFESPTYRRYRHFPHADSAETLAGMMAADQAFSDAGDSDLSAAFATYAAPDGGVIGAPPTFVFGRAAIARDVLPLPPTDSFHWTPVEGEVAASGDLGYTIGIATYRVRATGEILGYSKYLSIWKRQRNGEWRYVMDGGSGTPMP